MAPPCGRGRARALQRTKQHSSAYAIHTPIPKCRSQTGRLYQQPRRTSSPHPRPAAPLRLQRRPGPHARAALRQPSRPHTNSCHPAPHPARSSSPDRQFRCARLKSKPPSRSSSSPQACATRNFTPLNHGTLVRRGASSTGALVAQFAQVPCR